MKLLQDADEASYTRSGREMEPPATDTWIARIRQDVNDLEGTLRDLATSRLARSLAGAMVQVSIACSFSDDTCEDARSTLGPTHDEWHEIRSRIEQRHDSIERCLYSVMAVIEAHSGMLREEVGAHYRMSRACDPFPKINAMVRQDWVALANMDERPPSSPVPLDRDPLANLIRACRGSMAAYERGESPSGDPAENDWWNEHVGRHLELMASEDCPRCETYGGALAALHMVLVFKGDMEPRDAMLVERALAYLERSYPDRLFDWEQPEAADADLVELGALRREAERKWREFEPTYKEGGDQRDKLIKSGVKFEDPALDEFEAIITTGNNLMDELEAAARRVLSTKAYTTVGLRIQAEATRSSFFDRIAVPAGDREWQIDHLLMLLDSIESFASKAVRR